MQKKSRNFISNARPRNLYLNKEKRVFKITLLGDLRKRKWFKLLLKVEYFHYLDDDSYESVPPGLHKTTSTSDSSANFTKKDLSRILIQGRGILSQRKCVKGCK